MLCKAGALLFGASLTLVAAPDRVDFNQQVRPILASRCDSCHGGDKRSGGFSTKGYAEVMAGGRNGAAVVPGDGQKSLLMERIRGDREPLMPLGSARLPDRDIETIQAWIEQGARPDPASPPAKAPWVPSLSLRAPQVPDSSLTASQHPIDRFTAAYFQKHGIPMAGVVDDARFARRAYLDITGLLPSPENLRRFEKSTHPRKREALIDELLADGRNYSEHWISFWNDLLRNDGGDGYYGGRKSITTWLSRALKSNMPFDQFVSQLLNPAKPGAPEGFLVGVNWRGDVSASQLPVMQAAQNSAQVFLGVNLKCNSCHDSFISRWKLKDAYGLAAFFAEDQKLELVRCDNPMGQFVSASFLYPELNAASVPHTLNERRALVAKMFTDARNGRTPRTLVNRYWQKLLGRGLVADVDDLDGEPWDPALLDWLASDFKEHGYDLQHLLRTIMTSQAYQMPAVRREPGKPQEKEYVFRGPELRRISAEEFIDAVGAVTGEWQVAADGGAKLGVLSRDWRIASSPLSRALGRPIRDQVYTERAQNATTLQALELVNGGTLTHLINRGSERMLGQLKPSPANLFDSGKISSNHAAVDLDISGLSELRLLVADAGSYSPERVQAVWAVATLEKAGMRVPLSDLQPVSGSATVLGALRMKGVGFPAGLRVGVPSELVYDLRGKGFTRFHAEVGVEEASLQSDISPGARFFLFGEKPDWEHLLQVGPEAPVPAHPVTLDREALITRIFVQALGRDATASERELARQCVGPQGKPSASGLADLLWSIMMLPEFQLIG